MGGVICLGWHPSPCSRGGVPPAENSNWCDNTAHWRDPEYQGWEACYGQEAGTFANLFPGRAQFAAGVVDLTLPPPRSPVSRLPSRTYPLPGRGRRCVADLGVDGGRGTSGEPVRLPATRTRKYSHLFSEDTNTEIFTPLQ